MKVQLPRAIQLLLIIVGGASGIGRATVERLSQEGATVGIFDINKDAGEKLAGHI